MSNDSCGAPAGGVTITKDKAGKEAIVEGHVLNDGAPVSTGYARLLGTGDEFVAEVPLGEDGGFRFFAAPGDWTLRVLAPGGVRLEQPVSADIGHTTTVEFSLLSPGGTDFSPGGRPPLIPPGPRTRGALARRPGAEQGYRASAPARGRRRGALFIGGGQCSSWYLPAQFPAQ